MNKVSVRKRYLAQRNSLTKSEVVTKSSQIFKYTSKLPVLQKAKKISLYLPINNEVETKNLINLLNNSGKEVYLPKFISDSSYSFTEFTAWDNLEKGPLGILQPVSFQKKSNFDIDLAILPGVAFDKNGVRLGWGKGVFDRLLAKSQALRIGLAYDFQIVEDLPKDEHDLSMDIIVTEKEVIEVRG